jgi:hypothetical protein
MSRKALFGYNIRLYFAEIGKFVAFFAVLSEKLLHARDFSPRHFIVADECEQGSAFLIALPTVRCGRKDVFDMKIGCLRESLVTQTDAVLQFLLGNGCFH